MVVVKSILCPVDLSERSAQALRHASALASWLDAALTVLFVRSGTSGDLGVEAFTSGVLGPAGRARLIERDGHPAAEILRAAAITEEPVLVMGTHGRTGLQRLLLGSVTEQVVRTSPYPVLTVRSVTGQQLPVPVTPATIVCAVDFSDASARGLEYAAFLAGQSGARLLIVHALEWAEESEAAPRDGMAALPTSEQDAVAQLNDLMTDEIRARCDPELLVGYDAPAGAVLRTATEQHADVIVLGTQGRTAIDRALFGSTAQDVIRQATCPVLIVNGFAAGDSMRLSSGAPPGR